MILEMAVSAQEAVKTTGLNWESLSVIVGAFAAVAAVMLTWTEHRAVNQKTQIADAVNYMAQVLEAKLETKEVVTQISIRLARLEGALGQSEHGSDK